MVILHSFSNLAWTMNVTLTIYLRKKVDKWRVTQVLKINIIIIYLPTLLSDKSGITIHHFNATKTGDSR